MSSPSSSHPYFSFPDSLGYILDKCHIPVIALSEKSLLQVYSKLTIFAISASTKIIMIRKKKMATLSVWYQSGVSAMKHDRNSASLHKRGEARHA